MGLASVALIPRAAASDNMAVDRSDAKFIEKAGQGAQQEVTLGTLARNLGANQQVRDFGSMMVADHTKELDKVRDLAARKGVDIGPEKHSARATNTKLAKLSGVDFDRAYMKDMVEDHRKDLLVFQKMAAEARDPDVRQFATDMLPLLQRHYERAVAVANEVGAKVHG